MSNKTHHWADYRPFDADGDTWIPPGQAAAQLGWTMHQLYTVKSEGCLELGEEKIGRRPRRIRGRRFEFISQTSIDRIKQAREALKTAEALKAAKGNDSDELTLAQAGKLAKLTRKPLKKLLSRHFSEAELGRRIGLASNGRVCKRITISKSKFLDALEAERVSVPDDKLTIGQVVAVLDIDRLTAYEWCRTGSVYGSLDPVDGMVPTAQGAKPGILVSKKRALEIRKAMDLDPTKSFTDAKGVKWIPEPTAIERYDTTERVLHYQYKKRPSETVSKPYYNRESQRTAWVRFYTEDSLRSLIQNRRNGRISAETPLADERDRPAAEKHKVWSKWKSQGMSYEQIRRAWERQTGEKLTRDAIAKGIKSLQQ
jgi:hypothetical protein